MLDAHCEICHLKMIPITGYGITLDPVALKCPMNDKPSDNQQIKAYKKIPKACAVEFSHTRNLNLGHIAAIFKEDSILTH